MVTDPLDLVERSTGLLGEARKRGAVATRDEILALMREITRSGAEIFPASERERLTGLLDFWASYLRMHLDILVLPPPLAEFTGTVAGIDEALGHAQAEQMLLQDKLLSNKRVTGLMLAGKTLRDAAIHNCRLDKPSFERVEFRGNCLIANTTFIGGSFARALVVLPPKHDPAGPMVLQAQRAVFERTDLSGTAFTCTDFAHGRFDRPVTDEPVTFDHCQLVGVRFVKLANRRMVFRRCDLRDAVFEQGRLGGFHFADLSLDTVVFSDVDLSGTAFRNVHFGTVDLRDARNLEQADLGKDADLGMARLTDDQRAFVSSRAAAAMDAALAESEDRVAST